MSNFIYGIDFGTSNSVLAIYHKSNHQILDIISLPSVIYFYQESKQSPLICTVGKQGIDLYYKNQMKGRLMKSVKSILPNASFQKTQIYYQYYKAEDLVSIILIELKKRADHLCGEDIKEVIMGRPALFSNDPEIDQLAQNRLLKAAQKSGFENIHFQYEPIAAAYDYEQRITKAQLALVVDLGGGTSDFSLVKLDPEKRGSKNRKEDMLGKSGVYVAGDKLDSELMWRKVVNHFGYNMEYQYYEKSFKTPNIYYFRMCSSTGFLYLKSPKVRRQVNKLYFETSNNIKIKRLIQFIDNNLSYPILKSIEKAKIELSNQPESEIEFIKEDIEIRQSLEIQEFNSIISKQVEKITQCLESFLKEMNREASDIEVVFLTGGTSTIPLVQTYFEDKFGKENLIYGDLFKSVAKGLAISSNNVETF